MNHTDKREMKEKKRQGNCLYLECGSGISGDMMAAALLDLGADREALKRALHSLAVDGFSVEIGRVVKSGLDVCDFNVRLDAEHENHDHDMEYLYGGIAEQMHEEAHAHGEGHTHEHAHGETHTHDHPHPHPHRGMKEIVSIIRHADMTPCAKEIAERIFQILAEAEAAAHGVPADEVHFHEVGAVDSIVDIITVAVCLDSLDITEAVIPALAEGSGFIRCQHGVIPVPVPAVLNIVQTHRLHLRMTEIQGELVTPTGAAIAAAIRTSDRLPEEFTIIKTGMGAGKRNYERPSILRAMLIQTTGMAGKEETAKDLICKLETNIDDCTGEMLGYVMERLFEAGALDVHYTPVFMKKNRPAYQLNVICAEQKRAELEQIIFRETTTIGIRRSYMERTVMKRENREVETPLGSAKVKVCSAQGVRRCYPEYESAAELARKHGLSFQEVYAQLKGIVE